MQKNIDGNWSRGCLCRKHEEMREQSWMEKLIKAAGLVYVS